MVVRVPVNFERQPTLGSQDAGALSDHEKVRAFRLPVLLPFCLLFCPRKSKQHGKLATNEPNARVAMTTGMDASIGEELASVTAVMAACVDDNAIVVNA